jgi:DNA repair protein RecO (recombination protein O)
MYLSESELVEPFRGIYEDIEKLTAASHLLEIASDASIDAEMTRSIYPLLVHAMYYLSEGKKSVAFVISAYEWKMMDLLGYASDLSPCKCGIPSTNTKNAFSFTRCKIYCTRSACLSEACDYQIISNGGLLALQYIQASDLKKIFAFNATDEIISEISNLSRRYMCERLDKKYCKMDMLLSAPQWE